ncbi:hypothetical protein PPACK8108_LOCUS8622 [Phakopsora pachyrhizi]|uniref:hydroxymethylglutaryl-CoA lyase n=1 Tax=Phakopsora pachyrhizi TaxID=170000 RepID=A0AAV0AV20_PHAPC|nr:hypothetical protein PPACK8108_LOCUS8622 [Phakopsora pachyrhizi]
MSIIPKIGDNRVHGGKRPIRIMEVSPRDGLQNESKILPVELKLDLIRRLFESKLRAIEVGSFVSPKWVPQMSSTSEIVSDPSLRGFRGKDQTVRFSCLIPNPKGFETLRSVQNSSGELIDGATVDEIAIFASATESFSRANLNCTISESLKRMDRVVEQAKELRIRVRGYVSCVFGCPYQGKVDPRQALSVSRELLSMGCYEVSISDTIGVGVPSQVEECLNLFSRSDISLERLGIHCHDTFGTALANVLEAVRLGVQTVDSSVGGIGGCPYSPGATGNVATEDVVYALELSGYSTGLLNLATDEDYDHVKLFKELEPLVDVGNWINSQLNRTNSSRVGRAIMARKQRLKE